MVIVARPYGKRQLLLGADDPRLVEEVSKRTKASLWFVLDTYGSEHLPEALVISMADGITAVTMFETGIEDLFTGLTNYRKMLNVSLKVSTDTVLEELARISFSNLSIQTMEPISRLYLLLLIASSDKLIVSYDFANRLSQVLKASLNTIVRTGKRKESMPLISPWEMSSRDFSVSGALRLIYEVAETLSSAGVRAAEDLARRNSIYAPLALIIVNLVWDKLNINNVDKESVVNILRGVIS